MLHQDLEKPGKAIFKFLFKKYFASWPSTAPPYLVFMEFILQKYRSCGKSKENRRKAESQALLLKDKDSELLGSFLGDFDLDIQYPWTCFLMHEVGG